MTKLIKFFDFLFPRKPNQVVTDAESLEAYTRDVEAFHESLNEKLPDRYRSEIRLAYWHGMLHERHKNGK